MEKNLLKNIEENYKFPFISLEFCIVSKKGKKHILFGKKHKPETIEKMKQKKLGKKYSDVSRLKMSISQRKYKTKIRIQKYLNLFTSLDTIQNSNEIKGNL